MNASKYFIFIFHGGWRMHEVITMSMVREICRILGKVEVYSQQLERWPSCVWTHHVCGVIKVNIDIYFLASYGNGGFEGIFWDYKKRSNRFEIWKEGGSGHDCSYRATCNLKRLVGDSCFEFGGLHFLWFWIRFELCGGVASWWFKNTTRV